jgi:hypothetical protein
MKAISTTVAGSPISLKSFYAATVTPSTPARQVTVGQFPASNPNWSRQIQVSDEYIFVKRGALGVAISLSDIVNLIIDQEPGLTWTPPIVLTQPSAKTVAHTVQTSVVTVIGSEYDLTYAWMLSSDGTNWSNAITTTGIGLFSASVAGGGTGYTVGDTLTVAGGTHSVTATIKVTSISGGGSTGPITGVSVLTVGAYTVAPSATNSPTGGTGASASITLLFAAYDVATAGTLKVTPASAGVVWVKATITDDASSPGSITTDSVTVTST